MVLASSNSDAISDDDETNLFASLHAAGFERARILGLTLQSCSASGEALALASELAFGGSNDVLVIVFAQRKKMSSGFLSGINRTGRLRDLLYGKLH
jgi:hypothetical protein